MSIDLLTVDEAALILRVHPRSVYRAILGQLNGTPVLPAFKLGRRYFLSKSKLADWIETHYGELANANGNGHKAAPKGLRDKTS